MLHTDLFVYALSLSRVGIMQLFIRAQNLHTLEVSGQETVAHLKVRDCCPAW